MLGLALFTQSVAAQDSPESQGSDAPGPSAKVGLSPSATAKQLHNPDVLPGVGPNDKAEWVRHTDRGLLNGQASPLAAHSEGAFLRLRLLQ